MTTVTVNGVDGFVRGLHGLDVLVDADTDLVIFAVTALAGPLAGQAIPTGVDPAELRGWPTTPPHWVHLPDDIAVEPTNSQASARTGWTKHSRNIIGWGSHPNPAAEWIAHVAAVLVGAAR